MRTVYIVLFSLLFCACVRQQPIGSFCGSGIQTDQEAVIAEDAASRLASEYPPGRTALHLEQAKRGSFGEALESNLRARGFLLQNEGAKDVLSLTYRLDAIKDEPSAWYLHVTLSNGLSFSRVYTLGAQTAPEGVVVQRSQAANEQP